MEDRNPARSGDKQAICWMTQDKDTFYWDEYRTVKGQIQIYEKALSLCKEGVFREIRELGPNYSLLDEAKKPDKDNRWLKNIRAYIGTDTHKET